MSATITRLLGLEVSSPSTDKILRAARKLIETPDQWVKHGVTKKNGREWCDNPGATAFCLTAAVFRAAVDSGQPPYRAIYEGALARLDEAVDGWAHLFNDAADTTHPDVLAAFDKAIAIATAAPALPAPRGDA